MSTKTKSSFQRHFAGALCCASLLLNACGLTQAAAPIPMASVMQVIRDYGHAHHPVSPAATSASQQKADQTFFGDSNTYETHIASVFANGDFAQLEREAHEARSSQMRLKGGVWKLFSFYVGTSKPLGQNPSNDDWKVQIAAEQKWIAAYPESAAARITLAETYLNYGWAARGSGYANTVSDSGWKSLEQSTEMAKTVLVQSAKLKEKCPYWFEAMQHVALAEGWDKQQARELLDQAAAFEPGFYHYYREYANFVLPKWYGDEGDQPAFAEEMSKRLPAPIGSVVYFEIASLQACQCDPSRDSLAGFSWPKVKEGYAEMVRLYGTTSLKMNRFAYMSYVAQDKSAARNTFLALGDSVESTVWQSDADFRRVRDWALAE